MELVMAFLFGMMCGVGMFIAYSYHLLNKLKKDKVGKLKEEIATKVKDLDAKRDSIILRLKQAQAITEQQLSLRDATDQPSKNALHSRYKNGLNGEIKKLEEDKVAILKSILDDGFDPLITVLNEAGEREEQPLSHFVSKAQVGTPPAETPKKTSKFVILKGGKDDGKSH